MSSAGAVKDPTGVRERAIGRSPGRRMQDVLLHVILVAAGVLFNFFRLMDRRFSRAVDSFEAVYVIRTPSAARSLVFGRGRIRTRRGADGSPDYEIALLDPPGALKGILENPNDLITLVVENKINQQGNLFYLYKIGYLIGLAEARFRSLSGGLVNLFRRLRWSNER